MINDINQIKLVDIIVISEGLESMAIRAALESLGIQVRMHYIGNTQHLLSLLQDSNYLHAIVIMVCHGTKKGLILPKLASILEKKMPYHKTLTYSDFYQILKLNNQIVINTGCCLGNKKFADSFLLNGAIAYIGAISYIEGTAIILFIITLFYFYLVKRETITEAFIKAQNLDEETKNLKLWHK